MPPRTIRIGHGHRLTDYELADDFIGKPREELVSEDELLVSSEQLDCAVVRQPSDRPVNYLEPGPHRPVYRVGKTDAVAIPTGRLFVRLQKRNTLEDNAELLDSLGMQVESQNSWAPHTGWVSLKSGNVADAISRADSVAERLGARVEPELVSLRAKRINNPR